MKFDVLDKGYVQYVEHLGSDLSVVNAARCSFYKVKDKFDEKDEKLINYLAREKHMLPFRHPQVSLRVKMPIFVARQLMKYNIGFSWSEVSRRYVTGDLEFWTPDDLRVRPKNIKQGSVYDEDALIDQGWAYQEIADKNEWCMNSYYQLIEAGVAPEQARAMLPQSLYTKYLWTPSLDAAWNFLKLRLAPDTQWETQQYALAVEDFVRRNFPVTYLALEYELYPYLREP